MITNFIYRIYLILAVPIILNPYLTFAASDKSSAETFQLVQTTPTSLTILFKPQSWAIDSIQIMGELFQRFRFEDAAFSEESGKPQIPFGCTLVGIPSDCAPQYEILEADFDELQNVKLTPVPRIHLKDDMPVEIYFPDTKIYRSNEEIPAGIIKLDPPGFLRNQPVIRIRFFPIQFLPGSKRVRKYNRIKIRLTFNNSDSKDNRKRFFEKNESVYRQAILNYQQALSWRCLPPLWKASKARHSFSGNDWYMISIEREGMYKISGQFLKDKGISLTSIDPKTIKIYNNGGRELPTALYAPRPDSLVENAILVDDGGDGKFDVSDVIIFYGRGVNGFTYNSENRRFEHYIHHYATRNIYWLTWGSQPGKRMEYVQSQNSENKIIKTSFLDFQFCEDERLNLLNSGIFWLDRSLSKENTTVSYTFDLSDTDISAPINIRLRIGTRSEGLQSFRIRLNDQSIQTVSLSGPWSGDEIYVNLETFDVRTTTGLLHGLNMIHIDYLAPANYCQSYMDWIEIDYYRNLTFSSNSMSFNSAPDSGVVEYRISNIRQDQVDIYEISRFNAVRRMLPLDINADYLGFADSVRADSPKRYIALAPNGYYSITAFEKKSFTSITSETVSADYIIITPASFYDEARMLKSLRENVDTLKASVVLISDIFNEFGWGIPDPTAIRDFLKFAYENGYPQPAYVLLLGDGHYDYKSIFKESGTNWIPPHETNESNSIDSRIIDEWFARVKGNDKIMDLAIGRLPVNSPAEARYLVNRICKYQTSKDFGYWRNTVTMVADDEYGQGGACKNETIHTRQTEDVAAVLPEHFYTRKIYLVEYPAIRSASVTGITKPLVNRDIVDQINQGTVLINFIGHSKQDQFSHENVFSLSGEVPKLRNGAKLPFLISASCAFGRFDDPFNRWITEEMLLMENGGVIATFASARLAYADPNGTLNKNLIKYLFNSVGRVQRLGDAIRLAKAAVPGENSEKYHLLGDPALILNTSKICAKIDSVKPDSLSALGKIAVFGQIQQNSKTLVDFSGTALIHAFDLEKQRSHTTDLNAEIDYTLPGNSIFRGCCKVSAGQFHLNFIVPKDISYGGNTGRINIYAWDESQLIDAAGNRGNLYVGGTSSAVQDRFGPEIVIGIKDRQFFSGDLIGCNPVFHIVIEDSISGVNITNEIGHTITLMLDNDPGNKRNITHYFKYDEGSYTRGTIDYALSIPVTGEHQLEVKAWDNFNNSSKVSVTFTVVSDDKLTLRSVMNYPNPFSTHTAFTFEINQSADICIKIYALSGRLLRSLNKLHAQAGFNCEFEWDGTDEDGAAIANGVYLYKIIASKVIGNKTLRTGKIEKLIIMR